MPKNPDFLLTRRQLFMTATGVTAWYLTGCRSKEALFNEGIETSSGMDFNPIDRSLDNIAARQFFGDAPEKAHQILWDKENYLSVNANKLPMEHEKRDVVVIGGGIAGLTAAHLLRDFHPVVLEQAPRFGGNSKGQSWQGIDYSIGAAYYTELDVGTPLYQLLVGDLHMDRLTRVHSEDDPYAIKKHIVSDFWKGTADPSHRESYAKLSSYLESLWNAREEGEHYPRIPTDDPKMRAYVNELDKKSILEHLESVAGKLPPTLLAAIEYYCWSAFGAGSQEVSAASGLNFLASEWGKVNIPVGGNAAVTGRLVDLLQKELRPHSLRPSSLVIDVKVSGDVVKVLYEDVAGMWHSVEAKTVVMACPKFVVNKILDDIEPSRRAAINGMEYRPYLVGNALIKKSVAPSFYDLFLLDKEPSADIPSWANQQKITDVVLATYAQKNAEHSVLTLYRPLPFEGARKDIFGADAYEKIRLETENQVYGSIVPLLGLSAKDVVDFRITRWGHALPVARKGLIADGTVDAIRAPFRDRVFFAEQDNWALPCLETACTEALTWSAVIRKKLQG